MATSVSATELERALVAARHARAEGSSARALEILDAVLTSVETSPNGESPDNRKVRAALFRLSGRLFFERREWSAAASSLGRACQLEPQDRPTRLALARTLAGAGLSDEALEHLDELLADPVEPPLLPAALLLRAEMLRRLGDFEGSIRDYRRLSALRPLKPDEELAFSEMLLKHRQVQEVVLDRLERCPAADPRTHLLAAEAHLILGRPSEALGLLSEVIHSPQSTASLRGQAVQRLIRTVGEHPNIPGALAALDLVPSPQRNDACWVIQGNVHLASGNPLNALQSWSRVHRPTAELLAARAGALRHALSLLWADGDDKTILSLARTGLLEPVETDIAAVVTAALVRHIPRALTADSGRAAELLRLLDEVEKAVQPSDLAVHALLRADLAAARGSVEGVEALLPTLPSGAAVRESVEQLLGWALVRQGLARVEQGDRVEGLELLGRARKFWLPAEMLCPAPTQQATLTAESLVDRDHTRAVLETMAAAAGPGDPATCHNLAIYHLTRGGGADEAGDHAAALAYFERAIAYLGVVLAHFGYLEAWISRRAESYEASPNTTQRLGLERRVVQYAEHLFNRRTGPPRGELALRLRAELRGAKLLWQQGGVPVSGDRTVTAAGAAYVELQGLGPSLAAFLCKIRDRLAPAAQSDFARFFSPLRIAAVLQHEGQLMNSLERLRQDRSVAKEGDWPVALAAEYERELLLQIGESELAGSETSSAVERFQEALRVARPLGVEEKTVEQVRELAIGRAQVLEQKGRFDEGVDLLEKIRKLCGDESIDVALANLLTSRGIEAGNARRWDDSVRDLRKARVLNPSHAVFRNLVVALRSRAGEIGKQDIGLTRSLLAEAKEIIQHCRNEDALNEEMKRLERDVGRELTMVELWR